MVLPSSLLLKQKYKFVINHSFLSYGFYLELIEMVSCVMILAGSGEKMDYKNKVIVISGSSKGIGKCTAYYFAEKGANLVITYNQSEDLSNQVRDDIKNKYNVLIDNLKCDLKNEDDIKNLYKFIKEKYGKIDILINNAALSLDNDFEAKSKDEFMEVLEVNVVGTFLMIKYLAKLMDNGYIFNISSTDAIDTFSSLNIDYSASKASINNMTKSLALFLNSKVISLCPNWVDTESIREMSKEYLEMEMKRVKQDKLINPITIPKMIDKLIKEKVETGSIIRIDGDINE